MNILVGVILIAASLGSLWMVRARNGVVIPVMKSEFRQVATTLGILVVFFVGVGLLFAG